MIGDPADRYRLQSQLQRQLRERLEPRLQALFDELDARLFDLAERSRVGSQQHAYFDGLRECRRKRGDIEQEFIASAVALLRPDAAEAVLAPARASLSLVAHDELEETLALSASAERTASRLALPLDALDRRLAALLNAARDPRAPARLSPQQLGSAFRAACQRLDVGIEIRLVAYSLFAHHVFDALEPLYADFNRELIGAGILPALDGSALPPRAALHGGAAQGRGASPARRASRRSATPPRDEGDDQQAIQNLLEELLDLLARRSDAPDDPTDAGYGSRDAPPPPLPADAVMEALDHLHHFREEPHQLKQALLDASRRVGADARGALRAHDENTVDLVGMVFDFVRHDPDVPEALQPLIARLQVPFLSAALSDPELMQAADHPARRLVDELGELALGYTSAGDPEGQLLGRVAQIVESLLQPQETARVRFERASAELQSHLEQGQRRAELSEQRAVEAALGRERLRIARSRVAATLDRRLSRYVPLPWIRQLLRGPWANYLVLLWLRQGESGEAFREGLAFVDELLWCDEHGAGSKDDARLRAAEDELEEQLRHGLATVAYHDREVERLAAELRQFIASLRRRGTAPAFLYEIDPKLGNADFSLSWAEHELEEQPAADQIDNSLLARLRGLQPGTWFELGGRAAGERAKLSWTSPFTGRCLFVNRNGLRVDELTPERLADEIERGLSRILENTRLLQRALQTLLTQVRAGRAPSPQQSA